MNRHLVQEVVIMDLHKHDPDVQRAAGVSQDAWDGMCRSEALGPCFLVEVGRIVCRGAGSEEGELGG